MDKQLKVTLLLSAIDKVTGVINKIGDQASKSFTRVQKEADKIAKSAADVGKQAGVAGLALAAPLIMATKSAIAFEDKLADVAKVMNLEAGSEELRKVSEEVKQLSVYLAQTPEDVAELYANIAQGGVAANEVAKVAKYAGEIGVAFGISAGQAGESFIKLSNSMGITIDQTKKVTDALNHLGNNTASNSAELFEFLSSGGAGAARNLNMAGQEAAAFGSVLIANGKSASEAGTIFERMMKGIMSNKDMKAIFDRAGGGMNGVVAIMERGAKLNPAQQFDFFSKFGQYGTDISMFSKNLDKLKDTIGLVADETNYADSSNAEFLNRQKTMATQLQKVKTQATILAITIGEKLMPIIGRIVDKVAPLIDRLAAWIEANPELTETIIKVVAGGAALLLVVSGLSFALSGVAKVVSSSIGVWKWLFGSWKDGQFVAGFFGKAVGVLGNIFNKLKSVVGFATKAFRGLAAVLWANPISIVIGLVVALIAVIAYCVYKTDGWGKMWKHTVNSMKLFFQGFVESAKFGFNLMVNGIMQGLNKLKLSWYKFRNAVGLGDKEANDKAISAIKKDMANRLVEISKGAKKVKDVHRALGKEVVLANTSLEWNSERKLSDFSQEIKTKLGISNSPTQQINDGNAFTPKTTGVENIASSWSGAGAGMSLAGAGDAGVVTVNFSPTITMNGTGVGEGAKEDFTAMLRKYQPELIKIIEDAVAKRDRKKF